MDKKLFIGGLALLAIAILFGVLASFHYRDPIGIIALMVFTFVGGLALGFSFSGE